MIFLHVVLVVFGWTEDTAQFLHSACKWKCLQTHFLTFYRKRIICISNSEILSLFHWLFSMSSSWLWWWRPPEQCPSPSWEFKCISKQYFFCRGKYSLGFTSYFQEQKNPEAKEPMPLLQVIHSSFLQGAKLEYNDYIEEYLRERGWSNAREMKTESRTWHFILHYSPWDRRHKNSKLPVRVSSS